MSKIINNEVKFRYGFFLRFPASVVRLGDQNLVDSIKDGASPFEVEIKRFRKHPSYNKNHDKENDIALIELMSAVTFKNSTRPACLHQHDLLPRRVLAVSRSSKEAPDLIIALIILRLAGVQRERMMRCRTSF